MAQTTTVHCHDQIRTHRLDFVDRAYRHTISLNEPIWDECIHLLKSETRKRIKQQRRRTQPINVIISIDNDLFLLVARPLEAINRRTHIWQ